MIFANFRDYVQAVAKDPGLATISIANAAKALDISRGSVERKISTGIWPAVVIGSDKFVLVSSVVSHYESEAAKISSIIETIEGAARQGKTLFFTQVMSKIGLEPGVPAHRQKIGQLLSVAEDIIFKEHGIFIMSILHKKGLSMPSSKFFERLRLVHNIVVRDKAQFIQQQMQLVWDHYQRRSDT